MQNNKERENINRVMLSVIYTLKNETDLNHPMNFVELCKRIYGFSDAKWKERSKEQNAKRKSCKITIEHNLNQISEVCMGADVKCPICERNEFGGPRDKWELYYDHPFNDNEINLLIEGVLHYNRLEPEEVIDIISRIISSCGSSKSKDFEERLKNVNLNYALAKRLVKEKDKDKKNEEKITLKNKRYKDVINEKIYRSKALEHERCDVIGNLELLYDYILPGEKKKRKISFNLNRYRGVQEKNGFVGKLEKLRDGRKYKVTPLYIAIASGRFWLLAITDTHSGADAADRLTFYPIDLMSDITEEDEIAISPDEVNFIEKWEETEKYYFVSEHMNMSYDDPMNIVIRVRKKNAKSGKFIDTSYTLIYNTFGNDFYPLHSDSEEYDRILVTRSPYGIINWALTNTRDVEIETPEVRDAIKKRLDELNDMYSD